MISSVGWSVLVDRRARKLVERAPRPERERLYEALRAMEVDPLAGDVQPLKDQPTAFRRRVGDWRIFFDLDPEHRIVEVRYIERRTSTTYRKRR